MSRSFQWYIAKSLSENLRNWSTGVQTHGGSPFGLTRLFPDVVPLISGDSQNKQACLDYRGWIGVLAPLLYSTAAPGNFDERLRTLTAIGTGKGL